MSDFEQKLSKISSGERKILQCLSIFWEHITAPEFESLIKHLGLKNSDNRVYSQQNLSLLRNSLIRKGVVRNMSAYWGSGFQIYDEKLKEHLTRETLRERWFEEVAETIQRNFNINGLSTWSYNGERYKMRLLRDYRLSIYRQNFVESAEIFEKLKTRDFTDEARKIVLQIFSNPFQKEFFSRFDKKFQARILPALFRNAVENAESTAGLWEFVSERKIKSSAIESFEIDELIYKGEIEKAKKLIGKMPDSFNKTTARAVIALIERDYEISVGYFEMSIKMWKKLSRKRKGFPENWQMFFYALALFKTDEVKFYEFSEEFYDYSLKNHPETSAFRAVKALEHFLKNSDESAQTEVNQINTDDVSGKIVRTVVSAIIPSLNLPSFAREFAAENRTLGYWWLVLEACNLLAAKESKESSRAAESAEIADTLEKELEFPPIGNLIPPIEEWERALKVLTVIAEGFGEKSETPAKTNETRVAWQIGFEYEDIQPVEQKFGKQGWSKGRNIALKRLFERDVKNLTEQDLEIVKNAMRRENSYSYYGGEDYYFDWERAMSAMVGHPHLFLAKNPAINVQLVKSEPFLTVKETGENLEISFDTEFDKEGCVVRKETETRYKIVEITKQHVAIAESLNNRKLKIPAKGREMLMKAIQPLTAKIAIQSDLEEHFEQLPFVEAETRIHALITPVGEGFHLEFFTKPFGTVPPYFKPGKGNESVVAEIDGVRTRTKRDLQNERNLLDEVEEMCPLLAESESPNYEWNLIDPESCLAALVEMEQPRERGKLVVEWTKGQKLKLLGNINFENLSLSVKGKNEWFEISGEARVSEDLVLSMQELSKLIGETTSNFVELSDGQFIAITEKLRKHLQSLNAVMDGKNRLHNLRSGILEEFSEELENFKADKKWKEHLEKIKDAAKFVPELPTTFQAELRPYQTDGFFWLSRLANWGVGACLADDMGLGKAQPLDAKILTKIGWKLMAEIKVGDEIIGSKGKPIKVLGVYPQGEKDIYKVTFSDRSSTECCEEHLWTVNSALRNSRNYSPKVLSLKEIVELGLRDKAGNCNWFIPIIEAVEFETKDFYLDPYLLGVLIGDGGLTHGLRFSSVDEEIISEVRRLLPDNYKIKHRDRCDYTISKIDGGKFDPNFITREIKRLKLNTRSENKYIPFDYLHADINQRINLLQGLLDTDGYCSKESTVQFYTTSEQLVEDVVFLVRSLGGLARKSIKKTTHRDCYVLTLVFPDNIKPFRLSRKASRYQPRVKYKPSRAIVSIELVGKKQAQCIKVDAEDSLYVTDDFILTHNTLQALAILVERAEKGAALVVAPVSVSRNWTKEAMRFAPTLNFQIFGEGDRKTQVENLGKYDVLVVSYNLLQIEEELFTNKEFATVVLDEAQAIKNRTTKRSRAVMNLNAGFRLITTGTPIENHLGELWNLFNFINPGLLGSYDFFQQKFAVPIERDNGEETRKTLQRLINPFLLRRRKNEVLDDLPEKTEIMLTVEMSPEERAFYEALRREAVEKIESEDGETKDKRFRILAELTRLRLACCHPKLVNPKVALSSSKLELFGETLDELLENKHKALVFSQFVKHLEIIEEYLKNKKIPYHYLDGSTPPQKRQERIDAFQRGEGEVFLISLKAGGTGLNLTAADYVIHLDPWWNPAVEDQATDRVHRIGQQRPVTVYRLVTENTVEEKILKLHETKRDLADSLLAGTDASGKLSAEDLLALISEV